MTNAENIALLQPVANKHVGRKRNAWLVPAVLTAVTLFAVALYLLLKPSDYVAVNLTACSVLCSGPIQAAIQTSGIFNDSKTFVDMPLLYDPAVVQADFASLTSHSKAALQEFLERNFLPAGSDLGNWTPPDWNSNPPRLASISDETYREWAQALNYLWLDMTKNLTSDVYNAPQRHTLIPLRRNGMVVPGGRFREFYYWDSYWIVLGLLASDMKGTAELVTDNLLGMVEDFGFMPNGAREYYLSRSQPPLLSFMVEAVYSATHNTSFLDSALAVLDREYEFWMGTAHAVALTAPDGSSHVLNRFFANANVPRAESYSEDMATAANMPPAHQEVVWNSLTAAAESGWDFSARWISPQPGTVHSLAATDSLNIVPTDLNAIMCGVESTLASLHAARGQSSQAKSYEAKWVARKKAIQALLWDKSGQQWRDYNMTTGQQVMFASASNFAPMWTRCFEPDQVDEEAVVTALENSGLLLPGGVATTLCNSSQQWDFPNAWPPLQHIMVQSLLNAKAPRAQELARNLTSRWLYSNWVAWNSTGAMFEKYTAPTPGVTGWGGEYETQLGFGWTNGVVLALLTDPALFPTA
jgi:alpha,alpha-trehalase